MHSLGECSPWFVRFKPQSEARLRLFCVHHAGGSAAVFRDWCVALDPEVELIAIQLPGRGNRIRDPLLDRVDAVVTQCFPALQPLLDRPYAFFGYSNGALVAYELAIRASIQRLNAPLELFVAAKSAPQLEPLNLVSTALSDAQLIRTLSEIGGIPDVVLQDQSLLELMLPVLRADLRLSESYPRTGRPPLVCPITTLGGTADPLVATERLLAWRSLTLAKFRSHFFEGGHFFFRAHFQAVLAVLNARLREHLLTLDSQPSGAHVRTVRNAP